MTESACIWYQLCDLMYMPNSGVLILPVWSPGGMTQKNLLNN
jgi:hypothetical protein